ncbi:PREDICTED: synaptic vesicular amine transporter-like [Rhagoletis zephyria]|uniref:synaptic vesicular amine transporter-like n=1 Tax=Rhagoletis zephyria TaxID=28612 RepID=UPI000811605D|nr:PREDICTED: synaptic vesicular amine transporter-like [Rhagoletis zephyria]
MSEQKPGDITDDRMHSSVVRTASELNAASGKRRSSTPNFGNTNRCIIAVIVYFALLLDNVLLTVIVPILPDYLATINNRTQHTPLETFNSYNVTTAALSVGIANPLTSPHNLAYRYIDGAHQPIQTIMTKHPIPSKSNFTLLHVDDKVILTPAEHKQLRYINAGTGGGSGGGGIMTKSAITGNSTGTAAIQKEFVKAIANDDSIAAKSVTSTTTRARTVTDINPDGKATGGRADSYDSLTSENSSIGILLSMKALVQLIFNPIVGNMTTKFGYRLPIVAGTFLLLLSSLVFSVGETYMELLLARAIQGVGSACIGVCGMSLVAQLYPEEDRRSKVMGIILGSIALGVLLGYPFGSILYDLIGKSAPFIILSTVIFLNLGKYAT